jgi:VWFA-related protein
MRRGQGPGHPTAITALCVGGTALLLASLYAEQLRFKSGVNYVPVDVTVTDKDDQPVSDLTVNDFEIREKGRLQKIVDFERISTPLANRTIDLRAEPLPPLDVGTNARPPSASRAIAIVVGPFEPADLVPLKTVLTALLSQLQPDDTVAVTYTYRSDLGQDFTSDVGRLAKAVDNATEAARGFVAQNALEFAFRNVIKVLTAAPQARKAIFFVSNGVPLAIAPDAPRDARGRPAPGATMQRMRAGDTLDRLIDIFKEAREANVPVYTIDPHGLASPESTGNLGEVATPGQREGVARQIQMKHDSLYILADNTGGRAFVNQSNVTRAAQQMVTDSGNFYLLGFYPDPWVGDGQFHPIDVNVTRAGVRLRARAGYMTENAVPTALARPARLVTSLRDGLPGGDLVLRGFAAPIAPTRRGARTYLTLDVEYPELPAERSRSDDRLEVAWVALDPDARILASGEATLRVPLAKAGPKGFRLSVNQLIDAPAGRSVLRVAASSEALGTRGTVHMPLEVPRLGNQALTLAPLVLSASADPAIRVAHVGKTADVLPFQPTTRREFEPRESVALYARVFAKAPGEVTAELRLKQNGIVRRTVPLNLTPVRDERQAGEGHVVVPLAGLTPGEYAFEVVARTAPDQTAVRGLLVKVR